MDAELGVPMHVSEFPYMTKYYRERTIIAFSVCYSITVVIVVLRFVSRRVALNKLWWDDWLSVFGLVMTAGHSACVLACLPPDDILDGTRPINIDLFIRGAKAAYVSEVFYYFNQLALKFSFIFFYWRVFETAKKFRMALYFMSVFVSVWFITSFITTLLQCIPIQASWDPEVHAQPGTKCSNLTRFFFGTGIPKIVADFLLVLLPIPQVLTLKITSGQKAFVIFFFVLGGFVVIASIIRLRLVFLVDFKTYAINWAMDNCVMWTVIENCCGVISICLPSLRPIFKLLSWHSSEHPGSKGSRSGGTHTGTGLFKSARHHTKWSIINSSHEGAPEAGIRKETRFEVVSIEMNPTNNSSQEGLAGPVPDHLKDDQNY